jgi:phosphoserine phosphatase
MRHVPDATPAAHASTDARPSALASTEARTIAVADKDTSTGARPATNAIDVDTAGLLDRLQAARGRGPAAIALDGDGTLWQPDIGHRLVERTLAARGLLPPALAPLQALARRHALPLADDPHDQLSHIIAAYLAGTLAPGEAFRAGGILFVGHEPARALAWGERVVADLGAAFRIDPAWTPILAWARAADVALYVVTAGAWPGAVAAARRAGIPPSHVLACTHDPRDPAAPIPHGHGKPQLLRRRTAARLIAAFGDDLHDAPMLAAADLPVALAGTRAAHLSMPGLLRWHFGTHP